jgi:hypothetical protein
MPEYRVYMLTDDNKIAGPSEEVTCDDDQQELFSTPSNGSMATISKCGRVRESSRG